MFPKTQSDPQQGNLYRWLKITFAKDPAGNYWFSQHPNRVLTKLIRDKIRARLAFLIRQSPRYTRLQYAAMGAIFNCDPLEDFLSPAYRKEHEARLLGAATQQYYPLPLDMIDVGSLNPAYVDDLELYPSGNPFFRFPAGSKLLREGRFLPLTTTPLIDALQLKVAHSGQVMAFFSKKRLSPADLLASVYAQEVDFVSPPYLAAVAKLRYIFDGEIAGGFAPYVEFDEHGGHEHLSYRFDGGMDGLRELSAADLGPDFLSANPDLDKFHAHVVHPDHLTVPLPDYCASLKEKSLAATR